MNEPAPASGSHVQARNAADKPLSKRQGRPTPSRKASTSKLPEQPACCSEASEVVLICCDSPDCVADDVPVCSSDAGAAPDDCAECQQAAETGCTGDCLVEGAVGSADDCPECLQEERQDKSVNNKTKNGSKSSRILSATEAFDAEEPIQACDVPGCDALEWDEKAVDELVRVSCHSLVV